MRKNAVSLIVAVILAVTSPAISGAGVTELVNLRNDGTQPEGGLGKHPSLSYDGRYVAFFGSDLIPGVLGSHVFLRDRLLGQTEIVSVDSNGVPGNDASYYPFISSDGRFVAFESLATNLTPEAIGTAPQVFLRDRLTGTTELVSMNDAGGVANDICDWPSVSDDGRYVAFSTAATNLVPGVTDALDRIYVRDRFTGTIAIVCVMDDGTPDTFDCNNPTISGDGRFVSFASYSWNYVPVPPPNNLGIFVHDRDTDEDGIYDEPGAIGTELVNQSITGLAANGRDPWMSRNARFVAFLDDTKLTPEYNFGGVYLHDRETGVTKLLSVSPTGEKGDLSEYWPMVADDGSVIYNSSSNNIVPGDTNGAADFIVYDPPSGTNRLVTLTNEGNQVSIPTLWSHRGGISGNGLLTAFPCDGLVPEDSNSQWDLYAHNIDGDADGDNVGGLTDCDDYEITTYPGAPEVKHDGVDQDCNGYDLTIDVVDASYQSKKDKLTVQATSALGAGASLELLGFGPMTWSGGRWKITVEPAGGNPSTVTVSGPEGTESAPVQ